MSDVQLYTFIVDGKVHFLHGTMDACIDLMQRWGTDRGIYEIRPFVKCDECGGTNDKHFLNCKVWIFNA